MANDMDAVTTKKIYWEKVGEMIEGKTLTVSIDGGKIFDKKVPAGKYFNGRVQVIGELVDEEDRPVEE